MDVGSFQNIGDFPLLLDLRSFIQPPHVDFQVAQTHLMQKNVLTAD
jgi:hypothetical protein